MRISDWISDVCSSDLPAIPRTESLHRTNLRTEQRRGRVAPDAEAAPGRGDPLDDRRRSPRPVRRVRTRQDHHPAGSDPRSEEHTSELQSLMHISYAVFCLKKKQTKQKKQ